MPYIACTCTTCYNYIIKGKINEEVTAMSFVDAMLFDELDDLVLTDIWAQNNR